MPAYQNTEDLARKLQSEFGEENVELHGKTVVTQFDDIAIVISAVPSPKKFMLFTVLGDLPAAEQEQLALLKRLMKANTFFAKTAGYTLSANEHFGVLLQGRVNYEDLEKEEDLLTLLRNFVNVASYWKEHSDLHSLADEDKPEDDPLELLFMQAIQV